MSQSANLWLYFVMVFGIIALPGLDMAFVMGSSLLGGKRSGAAAVAGIVAGGVCHLLLAALGAGAILKLFPGLFKLMLGVGALYIVWIGVAFLRAGSAAPLKAEGSACPPATTFRRAMATSLLNPKAYMFMFAIFPQFLKPGAGALWAQAAVLGAITALTQVAVYGSLAILTCRAGHWLGANPAASTILGRAMGVLLIAVGVLGLAQLVNII